MTHDLPPDTALPDLALCDREPIHIPGAIQPHGVLLALHGPALRITQVSASCATWLGRPPAALLGRALADALGASLSDAVAEALTRYDELPDAPAPFVWSFAPSDRAFAAQAHRSADFVVLELEPLPASPSTAPGETLAQALRHFGAVRAPDTLAAKLAVAARLFRRLTGYDRVMIYRFDRDWHGEVIAEDRRADLESFLGLHYPASDIPRQARQLYLIAPARVIADIDAPAAALVPPLDPVRGQPLDLSHSVLRAVSPVHLEYLRNMGVRATLSAPLIRDGQLWGLVACHHDSPNRANGDIRQLAAWMAQMLSNEIALTEEIGARQDAGLLKRCRDRLRDALHRGARLPELLNAPLLTDLLGVAAAEGVALILDHDILTGGATPPVEELRAIARALRQCPANGPAGIFVTECLGEQLEGAAALAATAAGALWLPLDEQRPIHLLWLRGEQLRQVSWGGNPDKAAQFTPEGRIGPRQSFAAWSDLVRGRGRRWHAGVLESARELAMLIDIEWRREAEEALRVSLAEVRRHDARMAALNRMNNLLLACDTREEAYPIVAQTAATLFAPHGGGLAAGGDPSGELRWVGVWGPSGRLAPGFQPDDCWALRRGEIHLVAPGRAEIECRHFLGAPPPVMLCVPLNVRGTLLGLLHLHADAPLGDAALEDLRMLATAVSESAKLALSNLALQEALRGTAG